MVSKKKIWGNHAFFRDNSPSIEKERDSFLCILELLTNIVHELSLKNAYLQFSFWISVTLIKIYLSFIIINRGKNTFKLVGTVLKGKIRGMRSGNVDAGFIQDTEKREIWHRHVFVFFPLGWIKKWAETNSNVSTPWTEGVSEKITSWARAVTQSVRSGWGRIPSVGITSGIHPFHWSEWIKLVLQKFEHPNENNWRWRLIQMVSFVSSKSDFSGLMDCRCNVYEF